MRDAEKEHGMFLIFILILAGAGTTFSSDMYLPSMPAIAQYFQISPRLVQYTLPIYLFAFAFFQLFYGPISDKHGRKIMVQTGIVISLIGTLFCLFSPNIYLFFIGRFIQGMGAAGGMTLFRAAIRDAFNGIKLAKMYSYTALSYSVVFAIAPAVGGLIQEYFNWQVVFIVLTAYYLAVFVIVYFLLPETHLPHKRNPHALKIKMIIKNYLRLLKNPMFMSLLFCGSMAMSLILIYGTISPFLFQKVLGLTAEQYGYLACAITLGIAGANFFNPILLNHFKLKSVLLFGILLMCAASLVMWLLGVLGYLNIWVVVIPVVFAMFGMGFTTTNAGSSAFVPFGDIAGSAGAIYGCLQIFGTSVMSSISAHLRSENQLPLADLYMIVSFLALFSYLFFARPGLKRHLVDM